MKPVLVVASAVLLAAAVLPAPAQTPQRQVIPGADNMTPAEREAYRASKLVGDPARGAKLHNGCFGCHGVERYTAPLTYVAAGFMDSLLRASGLSDLPPAPARFKGRAKSLAELRAAVQRRNDFLNPRMTDQEVEDVVAYLNATYYNFKR